MALFLIRLALSRELPPGSKRNCAKPWRRSTFIQSFVGNVRFYDLFRSIHPRITSMHPASYISLLVWSGIGFRDRQFL